MQIARRRRRTPRAGQVTSSWLRYVKRILFVALPRKVEPAAFTRAAVAASFASMPSFSRALDRRAALIGHLIRQHRCQILAEAFDGLREGGVAATGFAVSGGKGEPAAVPAPTWGWPELLFDLADSAVLAADKKTALLSASASGCNGRRRRWRRARRPVRRSTGSSSRSTAG